MLLGLGFDIVKQEHGFPSLEQIEVGFNQEEGVEDPLSQHARSALSAIIADKKRPGHCVIYLFLIAKTECSIAVFGSAHTHRCISDFGLPFWPDLLCPTFKAPLERVQI